MDEMTFQEFKQLMLSFPPDARGAPGEFARYLRSGCSEQDAKRWLCQRIWDFDEPLRSKIVIAFATDALHKAGVTLPTFL